MRQIPQRQRGPNQTDARRPRLHSERPRLHRSRQDLHLDQVLETSHHSPGHQPGQGGEHQDLMGPAAEQPELSVPPEPRYSRRRRTRVVLASHGPACAATPTPPRANLLSRLQASR